MAKWISVDSQLPASRTQVLILMRIEATAYMPGSSYVTAAWYVGESEVQSTRDWYDDSDAIYDEEDDVYYLPEGWYQSVYDVETFYSLRQEVTHWAHMPAAPQVIGSGI